MTQTIAEKQLMGRCVAIEALATSCARILMRYSILLMLFSLALPSLASAQPTEWVANKILILALGVVGFLVFISGLFFWSRSQKNLAQFRTKQLMAQLTESNAQTRDLQQQLAERARAEEALLRRENLKRIIANLSSDFVHLGLSEIDKSINRALSTIGEFAEVARSYVLLLRADGKTVDTSHEWCAPKVRSSMSRLQAISLETDVPWLGRQMNAFRQAMISEAANLPPEGSREKELFLQQEIRSMLCVPMMSGNKLRGILGCDSIMPNQDWPEDLQDLLRTVGSLFTNVLDRQRAEITLRESEERFRELADLLPQTVFETDARLRVIYSNRYGLELMGYNSQNLAQGIDSRRLFEAEERAQLKDRLNSMSPEEGISGEEFQCLKADGSPFPALIYSRPIFRAGVLQGFRGILIDLTQRKKEEDDGRRLEAQFLQAQKFESLSVMAGSIAHCFNNLLTVALGNLEMVLSDSPSEAPWLTTLREVDHALRRSAELSSMMLTYVGKSRMYMEEEDLSEIVTEICDLLRASLPEEVSLLFEPHIEPCVFKGDASQIRQVVVNLLNNASEAMGESTGNIHISTGKIYHQAGDPNDPVNRGMAEGEYVYLELRDPGCGMNNQTKSRVFDPFFTTKFTGRGLGLAAVLGIVRAHHGGISLKSELGQGTTVRVMFPSVKKLSLHQGDTSKRCAFKGSGTVLVVDDEPLVLGVGERMLRRLGFDVITATDGKQALDLFRERDCDIQCVLLDLTMPRMDGEETFRELCKLNEHVRVVVASGYSEDEVASRFGTVRPIGFIRKPFHLTDLAQVMEAILTK